MLQDTWGAVLLGGVLLVLAGSGCSMFWGRTDDTQGRWAARQFELLPADGDELRAEALRLYREDAPADDVAISFLATCKALDKSPGDGELNHLASLSCLWLTEYGRPPVCYDPDEEGTSVPDCTRFGQAAVAADRDNAAYQYYLSLNMALALKMGPLTAAPFNLSSVVKALKRSVDMDPDMDDGGPLRVLGALYLKAPPWPAGVGDEEKALELLEQAVEDHPDHPLNHLFLAEAQIEDEEYESAQEHIDLARKLLDPARFHWRAERWGKMVDDVQKTLDKRK
jgi:tetratricopeptide (TPR) repeat protein